MITGLNGSDGQLSKMVGMTRLELATSWTQIKRSSQTELHSETVRRHSHNFIGLITEWLMRLKNFLIK